MNHKIHILISTVLFLILNCNGFKLSNKKSFVDLKGKLRKKTSDDLSEFGKEEKIDPNDGKKLRERLFKIFTDNRLDLNMLRKMIAYSNTYLIFDCLNPSYVKPNHQLAVLKNHVLNDHLDRIKHPMYSHNESTSLYICDKSENIWRINPVMFNSESGYIGFDDERPAEADSNFVTFADVRTMRDYLRNVDGALADHIVELVLIVLHHPKYYAVDGKRKHVVVDILAEQEKKLPKWFREMRRAQMDALYDKITAKAGNFTIEKSPGMQEYLFGNGYSLILFDCDNPSYLFPKAKKPSTVETVQLSTPQIKLAFKKMGRCGNDGVWRRLSGNMQQTKHADPTKLNYLTYDVKTNGLGYSPSIDLLKIMRIKGLCDEFMKFSYHPGYFLHDFKNPPECAGGRSDVDEERKISKIVDDYNEKNNDIYY